MKQLIIISLLALFVTIPAQRKVDQEKLFSEYAKKENRLKIRSEFFEKIKNTFSDDINEDKWIDTFLDVELLLYKDSLVQNAVKRGLGNFRNRSDKFKRQVIETAYTLYPESFDKEIKEIFDSTEDVKVFSSAAHYLLKSGKPAQEILDDLKNKFPSYEENPVLKFLAADLESQKQKMPDLSELFRHDFQDRKTIIYSLHRKDRKFPGLTIIKGPDGKFVRDENGSIFSIPQLALSATNLPGYMKNGNTPQGIFSVVGFYISPTETIGPTPNVLTRIPFEVSTKIFYHGEVKNSAWKLEDYKNLLPESWKNYLPIMESFYSGKSGRRLIVMHGSVDDLWFYEDQPFFPLTPTRGCLSTKELWNDDGNNKESDQAKLMNAFFSTEELEGFLVVINIDDKKAPVRLEEILPYIEKAESENSN